MRGWVGGWVRVGVRGCVPGCVGVCVCGASLVILVQCSTGPSWEMVHGNKSLEVYCQVHPEFSQRCPRHSASLLGGTLSQGPWKRNQPRLSALGRQGLTQPIRGSVV